MIVRFIKFIINDVKQDIRTLVLILKKDERAIGSARNIGTYIKTHIWEIIRDNWYWFLLLAAAFFAGWGFAGGHYSNECNRILIERGCDKILPELLRP